MNASVDGPTIPYGSHDTELFTCLLRNTGMSHDEIKDALIGICGHRCLGLGADCEDVCEKKANKPASIW